MVRRRRRRLLAGDATVQASHRVAQFTRVGPDVVDACRELVDRHGKNAESKGHRVDGGVDEEDAEDKDEARDDDRMVISGEKVPKLRHAFRPMLAVTQVTRETGELDGTGLFGFYRLRDAGIFRSKLLASHVLRFLHSANL